MARAAEELFHALPIQGRFADLYEPLLRPLAGRLIAVGCSRMTHRMISAPLAVPGERQFISVMTAAAVQPGSRFLLLCETEGGASKIARRQVGVLTMTFETPPHRQR